MTMESSSSVRFLNEMFDSQDRVAILAIPRADKTADVTQRFSQAGIAAGKTQAWLRHLNAQRCDIYLGVNPLRDGATQREKQDIAEVHRLQVDLDTNGPENLKHLLGDVKRGTLPQPRHLLRSSKDHYQVLWDTARGQWTNEQAETTMRGLAKLYGGDPACSEVARVMRWPGFRNQKEGRQRAIVRWIDLGGRPVTPDDFRAVPVPEIHSERPAPTAHGRARQPTERGHVRISQSERDWAWTKDQLKAGVKPARVRQELAVRRKDKVKPADYAALTVEKAMAGIASEREHNRMEVTR